MPWLPDLSRRQLEPEIMDDPALDVHRHWAALASLSRLNRLSSSARILWRPIQALALSQAGRPLRILDIATGAGDIPLDLSRWANRRRMTLDITAIDISEKALEFARTRAQLVQASINFQKLDVLQNELSTEFDVVMCSLFLHHLQDAEAVRLLQRMAAATTQLVLVNDLRRGAAGWMLAVAAARLLTRSEVVQVDGPLSVRAALTIPEARALAERAGLQEACVTAQWPCRYLLQWQRQ